MPLFEYADLVWGDKHNITLMSSLQVLQNKAAKVILNRPLYSSSTEALAVLKWLPLEKRRFQRRCVHVYKCINGLINHDIDLIRQDVLHRHNTRNKGNFRLPRVKRNWGKQITQYHAVSDFNSLSQTIKDSRNVNSFKRNVFKFLIQLLTFNFYLYLFLNFVHFLYLFNPFAILQLCCFYYIYLVLRSFLKTISFMKKFPQ